MCNVLLNFTQSYLWIFLHLRCAPPQNLSTANGQAAQTHYDVVGDTELESDEAKEDGYGDREIDNGDIDLQLHGLYCLEGARDTIGQGCQPPRLGKAVYNVWQHCAIFGSTGEGVNIQIL